MTRTIKILVGLIGLLILLNIALIVQIIRSDPFHHREFVREFRELPPPAREEILERMRKFRPDRGRKYDENFTPADRKYFQQWREFVRKDQARGFRMLDSLERELADLLRQEKFSREEALRLHDSISQLQAQIRREGFEFFLNNIDSLSDKSREYLIRKIFLKSRMKK